MVSTDQPVIEATQVLSLASTMHCRHCLVSATSMSRRRIITQNMPLCFFNVDGFLAVSIVHEQRMTYRLFGEAEYPEHVPVCAYEDTGERSGFVKSVIPGADGLWRDRP